MNYGDELNLVASYDWTGVNYNIPDATTQNQHFVMKRNSINDFNNLVLPCNFLTLHLRERDWFADGDEISNTERFDCDTVGYQGITFTISGSSSNKGQYNLIAFVSHSPDSTTY